MIEASKLKIHHPKLDSIGGGECKNHGCGCDGGGGNQTETCHNSGQIILRIAGDEVIIEGTKCDKHGLAEVRCKADR